MNDLDRLLDALTAEQTDILRHSLGISERCRRGYRNHFVTGEGSTDYPICQSLVALGMMTRRAGSELTGGDDLFTVTDLGKAAAGRRK